MATRLPDKHYRDVAKVYTDTLQEGHRTNIAVQVKYSVPKTTADRWVRRARQLGFLGARQAKCSCRCPVHCP